MPVTVIGMGMSPTDLTAARLRLIGEAEVLVGGRRHLAYFPDTKAETREISGDLPALADFLKDRAHRRVVVLASGDPLFHGIGAYLVSALGPDRVDIHPNITSVAAAFARIKRPWKDAALVSLHARDAEADTRLLAACHRARRQREGYHPVAVLTGPDAAPGNPSGAGPAHIASLLLHHGMGNFRLCVLARLGEADESVEWLSPAEAEHRRFPEPNVVILEPICEPKCDPVSEGASGPACSDVKRPAPRLYPGMPETAFEHERELITKAEVRAVSLSKLRLDDPALVLWDLGAGSGSVSVEAGFFLGEGRILAVERHPARAAMIRRNAARFGVDNLEVVLADLPGGLDGLPAPDRVFVGGGGRRLPEILEKAASRLTPGGVMVVNTVLLETLDAARQTLTRLGFTVETIQVQINATSPMPYGERLAARNPVWIITATMGEKNP